MGPRRTTLALALLALGLLVASAGVAAASDDHGPWSSAPTVAAPGDTDAKQHSDGGLGGEHDGEVDEHHGDTAGTGGVGTGGVGTTSDDPSGGSTDPQDNGHSSGTSGTGSTGAGGGGEVTGTSVGTPPAPVEAPPAAASGPAPDAVAAAPILSAADAISPLTGPPVTDTFTATATGFTGAATATAPAAVADVVPNNSISLAALPVLGSIGTVASTAHDGPPTVRALLETRTGRSLAVILALLGAILLFLAIHRRLDRGDAKLAAARIGPEVVRFR